MANNEFIKAMNPKFPELDVERIIAIFEDNISQVKIGMFVDNPDLRLPLGCDLNKNIVLDIISRYLKEEYRLGDVVTIDRYENEQFEVVGIRKDQLELRGDWSAMNNVIGDSWYPTEKCKKVKNGK